MLETHPFTYIAGFLLGNCLTHVMPVAHSTKAQLHVQPALARQYALFGFALDIVDWGATALCVVVVVGLSWSKYYIMMRLVKLFTEFAGLVGFESESFLCD